jgi:N-hydroxyarylamine O-acetyltransferase
VANHYTSTHPSSIFVKTPTVQLTTPEARYIVRGRWYSVDRGDETAVESREIEGNEDLSRLLALTFGLNLPPGSRFLVEPENTGVFSEAP